MANRKKLLFSIIGFLCLFVAGHFLFSIYVKSSIQTHSQEMFSSHVSKSQIRTFFPYRNKIEIRTLKMDIPFMDLNCNLNIPSAVFVFDFLKLFGKQLWIKQIEVHNPRITIKRYSMMEKKTADGGEKASEPTNLLPTTQNGNGVKLNLDIEKCILSGGYVEIFLDKTDQFQKASMIELRDYNVKLEKKYKRSSSVLEGNISVDSIIRDGFNLAFMDARMELDIENETFRVRDFALRLGNSYNNQKIQGHYVFDLLNNKGNVSLIFYDVEIQRLIMLFSPELLGKIDGILSGHLDFKKDFEDMERNELSGSGEISIKNGYFQNVPIVREYLKSTHIKNTSMYNSGLDFQSAHADLVIDNEVIQFNNMLLKGKYFDLSGEGELKSLTELNFHLFAGLTKLARQQIKNSGPFEKKKIELYLKGELGNIVFSFK